MNKLIIRKIAAKVATPFYCYQEQAIQSAYQNLETCLPPPLEIFYSLKANPNIHIASVCRTLGAGAEVCSYLELLAAIRSGFKPENIIFVGPAKSKREIIKCLELKIYCIVCESLNEYQLISRLAEERKTPVQIMLRVNPDFATDAAPLKMGGQSSQFGIDQEFLCQNSSLFQNKHFVNIIGLHVYNGTRILSAQAIAQNTQNIFILAERLSKKLKIKWQVIDIGGGFGVPYFNGENPLDLVELQKLLLPIIETYQAQHNYARIILESGRFLVAQSGYFVSRVIDIKTSKGKNYIVTDGGTNCHMAAAGLGSFIKRNFPIEVISLNKSSKKTLTYQITGPLCTPNDIMARDIELPMVAVNDLIVVKASGAYGPTASPVYFLSHGFPQEVLIKDNKFYLIRHQQSEEDFFNQQKGEKL